MNEKAIPVKPPLGLLMSMAIRHDHGLAIRGYYDNHLIRGHEPGAHARRVHAAISQMRQVYEEVAGQGFYRPEKEADYVALIDEVDEPK